MTIQNLTQIPAPRVPLIDERSGLMSREWYRFFINLFNLTGNGSNVTSLTDLQIGPPAQSWQEMVPNSDATVQPPIGVEALAQIAALVSDAQPTTNSEIIAQLATLANEVEAALLQPPVPEIQHLHYGAFHDTTSQTAAAINTAYAMTFNSTDFQDGVEIGSPTSRIICRNLGVYNFQFSAQATTGSASSHYMYVWPRVNGVDIPDSSTRVEFKGSGNDQVLAWNFLLRMQANDYFELMWSATDTSIQLSAYAASAPSPAIPSVILTVTEATI